MEKTLLKLLPETKENFPLATNSTFKVGGPARYFFIAKTKQDIIKAVKAAIKLNIPYLLIGWGANILISDKGFEGLVIKIQNTKYKIQNNYIEAEAGALTSFLATIAASANLTGLEFAQGIPGTLGGAIYGNAGAFGKSVSDIVEKVEVLKIDKKNTKRDFLAKDDCQFGYRESIFKKSKNWIILSAKLRPLKGNSKEIQKKMREYGQYRKERQHLQSFSAGSVFKNFKIEPSFKMLKKFPEFKKFINSGFIPAGYLIDKAGCKGMKIGAAIVSEKHANFIVNQGGAKAKDIFELSRVIKGKVFQKFGIKLEREIQLIGF